MKITQANLKYKQPLIPLDLSKVEYIFIHHPDASTASSQDIHKWHLENGWNGAGYNEYIRKDGTVEIMRGDNIGAQLHGYNSKSYGICCEGDYDHELDMPKAQFNSLVERVKYHQSRFNKAKVLPHNAMDKTSCPGKYFPMLQLYEALKKTAENSLVEASREFLKNYNEPIIGDDAIVRLAEIYKNSFSVDAEIFDNIKKDENLSGEDKKRLYTYIKNIFRTIFR